MDLGMQRIAVLRTQRAGAPIEAVCLPYAPASSGAVPHKSQESRGHSALRGALPLLAPSSLRIRA